MRADSGRGRNEDLRAPGATSWSRDHEVSRGDMRTSGGRPSPWCRSGTASGPTSIPSMSDSATIQQDMGAERRMVCGAASTGPHPPSGPELLLSSPRPRKDAIKANLTGYYGNSARQPLARQLRKAQPIRSCRRSQGPTPTHRVWAGVRRCGEEEEERGPRGEPTQLPA